MTGYDTKKKEVGRRRATVAELRCDYCSLTYGTAPCTASVGVTGSQKCFNTRKTCQDPANYSPQPKSYFFSDQPLLLPPQGQMVIVAGLGQEFAVSFDGVGYSLPPSPPVSLHFMVSGASSLGDVNLSRSDFGTTWVNVPNPLGAGVVLNALGYGNGLWLIGNIAGASAAISTDGIAWTTVSIPFSGVNPINGFAYGAGLYFAFVGGPAQYATSPSGVTWTARTAPMAANFRWLDYDGSVFVCAGEQAADNTQFFHSSDGLTWTAATLTVPRVTFGIRKIAHGAGLFVAVGYRGGTNEGVIYSSPDGITWAYRANPWNGLDGLVSVAFGNSIWVASATLNGVLTSPDGVTWTSRTGPSPALKDLGFRSGLFYGLGDDNFIYTSVDGITWSVGINSVTSNVLKLAVRP